MKQPFNRAREARLLFVGAKGFSEAVDLDDGHWRLQIAD
jgi:hypothetical protein